MAFSYLNAAISSQVPFSLVKDKVEKLAPFVSNTLLEKLKKEKDNKKVEVVFLIKDDLIQELPDGEHFASSETVKAEKQNFDILMLDGKPALIEDFTKLQKREYTRRLVLLEKQKEKRLNKLEKLLDHLDISPAKKYELMQGNGYLFTHNISKNSLINITNQLKEFTNGIMLPAKTKPNGGVSNSTYTDLSAVFDKTGITFAHLLGYKGSGVSIGHTGVGIDDVTGQGVTAIPDEGKILNSANLDITTNKIDYTETINIKPLLHPTLTFAVLAATAPSAKFYIAPTDMKAGFKAPINLVNMVDLDIWTYSGDTQAGSTTTYQDFEMFWDNLAYNNKLAMFNSSGNDGSFVNHYSRSFNTFSIGGYNTYQDGRYLQSNFINPSYGVEKPDLLASAVNVRIPIVNDYKVASGTSIAAPIAAGMAAVYLQHSPGLKKHPEALKAYMMARTVARQDVKEIGLRDELNGAGVVGFSAGSSGWRWWTGGHNSHFINNKISFEENLETGKNYRMAISWLVPGTQFKSTNIMPLNLDLEVRGCSNNRIVASSTSPKNNSELINFTVPSDCPSGAYTVNIIKKYDDGTSNLYLGFARFKKY